VVAQAERFRQRLGYWETRVAELDGVPHHKAKTYKAVFAEFVTRGQHDEGVKNMRRSVLSLSLAALVFVIWPLMALAATDPGLGGAGYFAVLAGTTVTNTGPSWITGQLGVSPGTAVTGFPPGTSGVQHNGDSVAGTAQTNLTAAYTNAAAQP